MLAARETFRLLELYKQQGRSFTWETTLSSNQSVNEISAAKARGYDIALVFVALGSAQRSYDRVEQRVIEGGHAIPPDAINRRFEMIFENLTKIAPVIDRLTIIDNDQGEFTRVLQTDHQVVEQHQLSANSRINAATASVISAIIQKPVINADIPFPASFNARFAGMTLGQFDHAAAMVEAAETTLNRAQSFLNEQAKNKGPTR